MAADRVAPTRFYEDAVSWYDLEYESPLDLAENKLLTRRFHHLYDGGLVLDLGCGTGYLLELVDLDPIDYLGIDWSAGMVDQANAKWPHHAFVCGDAAQAQEWLAAAYETPSLVTAFWSINWADNLARFAQQAHAVLEPGGRALFVGNGPGRARTPFRGNDPADFVLLGPDDFLNAFPADRWHVDLRGMSLLERGPLIPPVPSLYLRAERHLGVFLSLHHPWWKHFVLEATRL